MQLLGDCPIIKYQICKDKLCEIVINSHPNMALKVSKYEFNSIKPLKRETLFIGAMTSVGKPSLAVKEFNVIVCGFEIISTPDGPEIKQTKNVNEGKIEIDLKTKFTSSEKIDCPIDSISLYSDEKAT